MKNNNLKLSYFIYSFIIAFFLGFIYSNNFYNSTEGLADSVHTKHSHAAMEVNSTDVPSLSIEVKKDMMSGWNLHVEVENFIFTPEDVNKENLQNKGHAHIFIDGVKITRLYSNYYYISDLEIGEHEIEVILNRNDHSSFIFEGEVISSKVIITQE